MGRAKGPVAPEPPIGYKTCFYCRKFYQKKETHPCFMPLRKEQKRARDLADIAANARQERMAQDYWTSENEEQYQKLLIRRHREEAIELKCLLSEREDSIRREKLGEERERSRRRLRDKENW